MSNQPIDESRRGFFRNFLKHSFVLAKELNGTPHLNLSEIDKLTDDQILKIIPELNKNQGLKIEGKTLQKFNPDKQLYEPVFRFNPQELEIYRCFGSGKSLQEIADHIAPLGDRVEQVKSLFFDLINLSIVIPRNPSI